MVNQNNMYSPLKPFLQSISEPMKRLAFNFEDYIFEKSNGFELGGVITNNELVSENKTSKSHATAYHAVWCRNLRVLFGETRKRTNIQFNNFIDIGSGKGKACLFVHQKYEFEKIIGIEFSPTLIDIAEKNAAQINAKNIVNLNIDACEFTLPNANNFIFLFNPFDDYILNKFLQNNLEHFVEYNSIIAYANDVHWRTLLSFGFEVIFKDNIRKISLFQQMRD